MNERVVMYKGMKITIFIILFSTNLLNAMEERENSSIVPGGSAAGVGRNPFDDVMRAEFPFNGSGYVSFMTETDFTELPAVGKQQDEEQEEARDKNTGGIFNRVTQYFTKEAIDI